jgi:hypothetical protein
MLVLGAAGFFLSCLPTFINFGTIRPKQLQFPLSTFLKKKEEEEEEDEKTEILGQSALIIIIF